MQWSDKAPRTELDWIFSKKILCKSSKPEDFLELEEVKTEEAFRNLPEEEDTNRVQFW